MCTIIPIIAADIISSSKNQEIKNAKREELVIISAITEPFANNSVLEIFFGGSSKSNLTQLVGSL